MKHAELIQKFTNIGCTHQWEKLGDLLTPDFYFKSSYNYVAGAQNFIEFERNRDNITSFETQFLFESTDATEYFHIYNLTYMDPVYFVLPVHETIGVRNHLISYSILNAAFHTAPYFKDRN